MPDDNETGRQWIVEPPTAPGEVSLYLCAGEGVELNGEQEAALGALLTALEMGDAEVAGFDAPCPAVLICGPQATCEGLSCGKVSCSLRCVGLTRKAAAVSASASSWNLMGTFSPNAI